MSSNDSREVDIDHIIVELALVSIIYASSYCLI